MVNIKILVIYMILMVFDINGKHKDTGTFLDKISEKIY